MATTVDDAFEGLLDYIKRNRGFDFTGYKRPSLVRRFEKRMQEVGCPTYAAYLDHLETNPREFVDLFNTILINVTSFFRDEAAWDALVREVAPRLVERAAEHDLRVWVAGCASGEEAYTVAMVLADALGEERFRETVKIYATDVDDEALAVGRAGRYPHKALETVPADLRERYFELADAAATFRSDLRRNVIFGRHDLIQDPPISRVDLLLARNTLMYFNPETQGRILGNFHFALRDAGFLFLGKSEVLLSRSTLFAPVDLKQRIFRKTVSPVPRDRLLRPAEVRPQPPLPSADERLREAGIHDVPVAHLVVNAGGELAIANAQARALFGLAQRDLGRPLHDLEVSYRPVELRAPIEQARRDGAPVTIRDVEVRAPSGETRFYEVQVTALVGVDGVSLGTGVAYTDVTRYKRLQESYEESRARLETAFEELQSTAEELETTNEELQSTNEELETTNEELQSTNEELETMNEELQSTNEELETMNDELRVRTLELHELNAFLESILVSLDSGVAVVDSSLVVQAWNARAYDLWGLRSDEVVGMHFVNLDIGLPVDDVLPAVRAALGAEQGEPQVTVAATNRRGREFRCRVSCSPLIAADGSTRGAILLMADDD